MSLMAPSHIAIGDDGVARVAGTRMKVLHIATERRFRDATPEQVKEMWPHLSLAQVYSALAYYYDHQAEIDAAMDRADADAERLRAELPPGPTREELERRLRERQG
jgi:uncharacterized protein (DUF433 family)